MTKTTLNTKSIKIAAAMLALATPFTTQASSILFAFVSPATYTTEGTELANDLRAGGNTVSVAYLNSDVIGSLNRYDEIFVYDLSSLADNSAIQIANYRNIANWYNTRADKGLILDGRIIDSASYWTNSNGMSSEASWIQNYATQLDLRGGGLVLGTDHDVFATGINFINDYIGVGRFTGYYYPGSYAQAEVSTSSPLYLASLDHCDGSTTVRCVNDNSSTSYTPTGAQANGQFLYTDVYHQTNLVTAGAAVSSNLRVIAPDTCGHAGQPVCVVPEPPVSVPEPGTLLTLLIGLVGFGVTRRKARR